MDDNSKEVNINSNNGNENIRNNSINNDNKGNRINSNTTKLENKKYCWLFAYEYRQWPK